MTEIDAGEATRLLAELPLELREVIVARLWGGLTFEEVARPDVVIVPGGVGTDALMDDESVSPQILVRVVGK